LATELVCGGALETETRIVVGMPDDDHKGTATRSKRVNAMPEERGSDALSLSGWLDGHPRQPHPLDLAAWCFNDDGREQDVADDPGVVGDE
jgi:hypothetical protein